MDTTQYWPTITGIKFSTYKTTTSNTVVAGSQTDWKAVLSGTTLTNIVRTGGAADTGNAVGDRCVMMITSQWGEDFIEAFLQEHTNPNGGHGNVVATSINTTSPNGINQAALPLGTVVQIQSTNFNAVATGTTIMPYDDTIPQITEGNEYMTQAITPKSTSNQLLIEANFVVSNSSAGSMSVGLFQDSTVSAVAATTSFMQTATGRMNITLRHKMAAGTTSATTFRIRAGLDAGGTTTFNGDNGGRRFGGITVSTMTVTEYKA